MERVGAFSIPKAPETVELRFGKSTGQKIIDTKDPVKGNVSRDIWSAHTRDGNEVEVLLSAYTVNFLKSRAAPKDWRTYWWRMCRDADGFFMAKRLEAVG